MDRLNYFAPYESKGAGHEDQLTRAFLVVLRYVPLAQIAFLEMIRERQREIEAAFIIPSFLNSRETMTRIATQVGQLNTDHASHLVSLIVTDKNWKPQSFVEPSDRSARYDGVLYFGPYILTLENKPYSEGIWEEQLNPGLGKGSELQVERHAVVLLWRDIISQLSALVEKECLEVTQRILIQDFMDFVQEHFPYINPYARLGLCRENTVLIDRRCHAIMEELAPGAVNYHRGGTYYISLQGEAVKRVILFSHQQTGEPVTVRLELYPGDTMRQAQSFYKTVNIDALLALRDKGWIISPNLHFSFRASHLHWITNSPLNIAEYLRFWKENKRPITQESRDESGFRSFFGALQEQGLMTQQDTAELQELFTNTKRNTINICPGVVLYYRWALPKAQELDGTGRFVNEVRDRIQEALHTWKQQFTPTTE